jgi:hypothetical protein
MLELVRPVVKGNPCSAACRPILKLGMIGRKTLELLLVTRLASMITDGSQIVIGTVVLPMTRRTGPCLVRVDPSLGLGFRMDQQQLRVPIVRPESLVESDFVFMTFQAKHRLARRCERVTGDVLQPLGQRLISGHMAARATARAVPSME